MVDVVAGGQLLMRGTSAASCEPAGAMLECAGASQNQPESARMEKSRRNNVILSDDQSNVREYDHENHFHKGFFDKVQGAFGEEVVSSKIQKGKTLNQEGNSSN
ncbi:uncharacterized protein LOC143215944 isoform X2 [Lasioglossum baleicum]|uniref:uncharacterized protein LOC143215944 isoform X2 n=1 Tax=Lasioglossum baleicum TaxID=434251 RepID=UPI003FCD0E1D